MSNPRQCGDCTACCVTANVPELQKLEYTPCKHLCGTGCAVYPDRPTTCRLYQCLWLLNHKKAPLDDEMRPDRWGLVLDVEETNNGLYLRVWEVSPGAWDRPGVAWRIRKIKDKCDVKGVVLWRFGTRTSRLGEPVPYKRSEPDTPWLEVATPFQVEKPPDPPGDPRG